MSYIAFLELISFEDFILNNDIDARLTHYSKFIASIEELFDTQDLEVDTKHWKDSLSIVNQGRSFLIWTDDDSPRAFGDLVVGVRNILPIALFAGFPVKAMIGVGSVDEIDRDDESLAVSAGPIFLSADVVRMQLELLQHTWSGCMLSNDTVEHFHSTRSSKTVSLSELAMMKVLSEYQVPETGEINYVIDWVSLVPNTIPLGMLEFFFNRCTNGIGARKFELELRHTHEFIKAMQSPTVN